MKLHEFVTEAFNTIVSIREENKALKNNVETLTEIMKTVEFHEFTENRIKEWRESETIRSYQEGNYHD
jgi:hypothetical protein